MVPQQDDAAGVEHREDDDRAGVADQVAADDRPVRGGERVDLDPDAAADVDGLAGHRLPFPALVGWDEALRSPTNTATPRSTVGLRKASSHPTPNAEGVIATSFPR